VCVFDSVNRTYIGNTHGYVCFFCFVSCISVREKWTVRSETSREYPKHRGKNGKVIPANIIKAYTGVEVQLHSSLMLARNGGEWSDPRLGRITTMERRNMRPSRSQRESERFGGARYI
jgi:hypothetical protein